MKRVLFIVINLSVTVLHPALFSIQPCPQMKEQSLAIQVVGTLGHLVLIIQGLPPVTNTSIIVQRENLLIL